MVDDPCHPEGMGAVKGGRPKGGGFFHLFDWNRKSRKKLFSVSPEQEKRSDASLSGTRPQLIVETETVGLSSMKGNCRCDSSATDEEGNGIRAPGVVARLMGLESMPAPGLSEPNSIPSFIKNSLHDNQIFEDQSNRTQKMPSSSIERFRTEILPPRYAKTIPLTQHKLLSPIKNSGVSQRNAAHIMEVVARILNPEVTDDVRAKFPSSFEPLNIHHSKKSMSSYQRSSRVLESPRRLVESVDIYLKEQTLNRNQNGLEDRSSCFRPSGVSDTNSLNETCKGKSISLAVQAKVNVQRRKGQSTIGRNALPLLENIDEGKTNQPFKSQLSNQKNKHQKKASVSGECDVLRQNNQKQNHLSAKGKLTPKQSVSNQQGRRILYGDASLGKNKISMLSGNSRVANRDNTLGTCTPKSEESISSNKDCSKRKRLKEGGFKCERNFSADVNPVIHQLKHVQPSVLIDEQSQCNKDHEDDSADALSNAFNSSSAKLIPSAPLLIQNVEDCEKSNLYGIDSNFLRNGFTSKRLSSHGLSLITGDALSLLLEQKLRELAPGDGSSFCNFVEGTTTTTSSSSSFSFVPVYQDQVSDIGSASTNSTGLQNQFMTRTSIDHQTCALASSNSSTNGHIVGPSYKLQGLERVNSCSSSSCDARNEPDLLQPSPNSILEASFSSESSNSVIASTCNIKGSKLSSHSTHAQFILSSSLGNHHRSSFEADPELFDSAASSSLITSANPTSFAKPDLQDLGYLREILNSWEASPMESPLNPLLFYKLESKRDRDGRTRRKMMFDRVNECLDYRCSRLLIPGFQAWANAESMKPKDIAGEVYQEISRWEEVNGDDCMVDELVEADMSGRAGRWVGFEEEAFELAVEMEEYIVGSFIDEFVADCFHLVV